MTELCKLKFYTGSIYKIPTLGSENSCYFHAALSGYNPTYIESKDIRSKTQMARTLRNLLAEKLDSYTVDGQRVYDLLSQGTLKNYAESVPGYSLKEMIAILQGNEQVDHRFQELLCETVGIDVYIIDQSTKEPYRLCNEEIYIKHRPSVVILYEPGHFSILGRREDDGEFVTKFSPTDEFILAIKKDLKAKSKN